MTHYWLRSQTLSPQDSKLKRMQLSDRSIRSWFCLNDLYSMWKNDGFSIALEEKYRTDPSLQKQKWTTVHSWNREKNDQLGQLYRSFQQRWGTDSCKLDVFYRLPHKRYSSSFADSTTPTLLYAQKVRCKHHRHKVDLTIDALLHPSITPFSLKREELSGTFRFFLVGFQWANQRWTEWKTIKYQALLQYSHCFENLWCSNGYFVYNVDKQEWTWYPRQHEWKHQITRMIRLIRKAKKHHSYYLDQENVSLPTFMLPNMKLNRDVWKTHKFEKAQQIGELTLLWNVSDSTRQSLWKKGIFSWKDPQFFLSIPFLPRFGEWKADVLRRIIQINQQSTFFMGKKKDPIFDRLCLSPQKDMFLDFEYTEDGVIYLVGVLYQKEYKTFWAEHPSEEEQTLLAFQRWMDEQSPVRIWYWHIDNSIWNQKCQQYPSLSYSEVRSYSIQWHDLCHFVRKNVVFNGVFDFSLKSIIRSFYQKGLFNQSYHGLDVQNGFDSLMYIKEYWKYHCATIKEQLEMYNHLDCKAVQTIFFYIKYESSFLSLSS